MEKLLLHCTANYRAFSAWLAAFLLFCSFSSAYATEWQVETVDSIGNVGQYTSLAAWNGHLYASYFDATKGNLKYASKLIDGAWTLQTIDKAANTGQHTSIDVKNDIHISYYKSSSSQLMYTSNESGDWGRKAIDSAGIVGQFSSIAVDQYEKSHISYYDKSDHSLKYANNSNGAWVKETVDSGALPGTIWHCPSSAVESRKRSRGPSGDVGSYSSIAVDSQRRVHISYYDITNGNLKYAMKDSSGWHISTIDEGGDEGSYSSLALDSADNIHISYANATSGTLKYATKALTGEWQITTIDSSSYVQGHTSIAVDSTNHIHLSYYSFASNDGDLRYATNASGDWALETVDSSGGDTENVGKYTSIAVDGDRNPHISYYDTTNGNLKYAYRKNPAISTTPAALDFGIVNYGNQSTPQTVTIANGGKGNLLVGQISINGPQSSSFIITADLCSGKSVLPLGSCSIRVAFAPATTGRLTGSLQISSNDPVTPKLTIALTGASGATHTITVTPGPGGSITPAASVTLPAGGSQRFHIAPDQNFYIYNVLVDHSSVGRPGDYLFSNVTSDHTIEAVFHSPVRVVPGSAAYYAGLQAALDAVPNGSSIQAQNSSVASFTGNFALNRPLTATLRGGYDFDFGAQNGGTVIIGTLAINDGGLEVEYLEIR